MEWRHQSLAEIAPAAASDLIFAPHEECWHLGLEHIESHTGRVTTKVRRPADAAGNSTFTFDERNVLYSKLRPYLNKVVVPDEPGIATTELIPLRPRPDLVLREYVAYYLRSPVFLAFASQFVAGTKMPRVILDKFWAHQVPLPPLSEQRRIVEILDQADRLRRLRAEADAKADRILPALFIKMFGDPATNPMGWPVVPVGECLAPISRRDPSDRPDEPFTYIDIAGIDGKSGAICDTKELLGADAPSRARQVIKAGDILVSTVRPYLRATAMVPASLDGQVCSTGFCVLRPRVTYLRGYLYTLTRTTWFTDQLMARTRGASYPAVTDRDILELRVPLPSDPSLLERSDSLIETLIEQRARAGKCRTAVDQLFGTLLCRAFDGSLTASWREAHMKELLQEMEQQAKALEDSKA